MQSILLAIWLSIGTGAIAAVVAGMAILSRERDQPPSTFPPALGQRPSAHPHV